MPVALDEGEQPFKRAIAPSSTSAVVERMMREPGAFSMMRVDQAYAGAVDW